MQRVEQPHSRRARSCCRPGAFLRFLALKVEQMRLVQIDHRFGQHDSHFHTKIIKESRIQQLPMAVLTLNDTQQNNIKQDHNRPDYQPVFTCFFG